MAEHFFSVKRDQPDQLNQLHILLAQIPPVMQALLLWQESPPPEESFASHEPFCLDTMAAHEWLQWVFLPKIGALLAEEKALPEKLALAPYFEETVEETLSYSLLQHSSLLQHFPLSQHSTLSQKLSAQIESLLLLLREIDQLFRPC